MGRWSVYLPNMKKPLIFYGELHVGKSTIIVPWMQLLMVQKSQTTTWHETETLQILEGYLPFPQPVRRISEPSTVHPGRLTARTYKSPILERKMILQPNLQGIMVQPLIFQGVWATKPTRPPRAQRIHSTEPSKVPKQLPTSKNAVPSEWFAPPIPADRWCVKGGVGDLV